MRHEASVRLYEVNQCGFYPYGAQEALFGSIEETLVDLEKWVQDIPLGETKTFDAKESGHLDPTYCFDLKRVGLSDFLLVTWNQLPASEGQIPSVRPDASVGSADVRLTGLPANAIPGYPSYFFIVPERSVVASIRFGNAKLGHRNMEEYLGKFLAKFSRHVTLEQAGDLSSVEVTYEAENDQVGKLYPRFKTSVVRRATHLDLIRAERPNINRIIRKNRLSPAAQTDTTILDRMLGLLGLSEPATVLAAMEAVDMKYEVAYTPDEKELEEIIQEWEEGERTKWDNVGFRIKGYNSPLWLADAIAAADFKFDVDRRNSVLSSESLIKVLAPARNTILGIA